MNVATTLATDFLLKRARFAGARSRRPFTIDREGLTVHQR